MRKGNGIFIVFGVNCMNFKLNFVREVEEEEEEDGG